MDISNKLPEPLVPAEIDLRGFPGFVLDVDRLLASELFALCTPEQGWAAFSLWCRAWKQTPPGSIPDDDKIMAKFSGAGARWPKVKDMALRGFVKCSDGRLYHRVLCEQVTKAWESRKASKAKREKDAKRLADWRERNATGNAQGNATETDLKRVSSQREVEVKGSEGTSKPRSRASTATAAAPPKPPDPVKDEIWKTGKQVLESEGKTRDAAGSFLGKLCKDYGQVLVLNAVRDCVKLTPAKPSEWLVARCQERRANAENKQVSLEERNRKATDGWMPPEMRENHAIG